MDKKRISRMLVAVVLPLSVLLGTSDPATAYPEPCAKPSVTVGNSTGSESNDGTRTVLSFTVKLSSAHCYPVSLDYSTVDGTATKFTRWTPYGDYFPEVGTLTIAAGATMATIAVEVRDDQACEGDEQFYVTASDPVAAHILDGSGTGTIATQGFEYDCPDGWV